MRKHAFPVVLFFVFMSALAVGSPLFKGGKSAWSVYVSKDSSSTVRYAAEEFVHAVERVSGVRLPVVHVRQSSEQVLIGPASELGLAGARLGLQGKKDEIAVYVLDGNLVLSGNDSRGSLYAVYAFLRRELGVRFLLPGPEGEFYPARSSYSVPALSWNYVPSFGYRGHHLCWRHVDAVYETWMARNFLNIMRSGADRKYNDYAGRQKKGIHIMVSGHNVYLPKELLKYYPECFAENNGVRHAQQVCLSNHLTEELIYEKMAKMLRDEPDIEILSIFPSDNMDYCRCALCSKRSLSTVWFDFYKRICTRLHQAFPKVKFSTLAYQGYLDLPETELRNSVFIEYAQHDRCYMDEMRDQACPSNTFARARMKKWLDRKVPLGIYGYEFDIMAQDNSMMVPFYPILAEGIRWYRDLGMRSVITEAWRGYPPRGGMARNLTRQNAFGLYLYAQMLWNADADPEKLLEDWDAFMFGAAAPQADQIMRKMADWYVTAKGHIGNFHNSPYGTASTMLNPQKLKELQDILKAGEAVLAKQEASKAVTQHRKNFAYLKNCVLQWDQAYWFSTQSGMTLNIPRAANPDKPFAQALKLPPFRSKNAKAVFYPTEIYLSWDANYLNLRAVCHDDRMQDLRATCVKRDEKVFNDDCLELFYANPGNTEGLYKHIMVNAKGTMMDAATVGPASYNTAWNPKTLVKTGRLPGNKGWTVELRIPHEANGPAPKAGESWRGSIMRTNGITRSGLSTSGYPINSYHDPNSFATFYFNEKTDTSKRMLMVHPPKISDINLKNALLKAGWTASLCSEPKTLPQDMELYDVLIVRLPQVKFNPKLKHVKLAKEFLKRGKVVIYSSYEWMPLEYYFGDPNLKLECSTWKIDKVQRSLGYGKDIWWTKPHNLLEKLSHCIVAPYGYAGTDGGWRNLVSFKLKNGRTFPWMIARPYDRGLLVVTGAEMGLAGGGVIFGNGMASTVPQLLENLLMNKDALRQPVKGK